MTGIEAFIAAVALSFGLQMTCVPAGPEDPPSWDYACPFNLPNLPRPGGDD